MIKLTARLTFNAWVKKKIEYYITNLLENNFKFKINNA